MGAFTWLQASFTDIDELPEINEATCQIKVEGYFYKCARVVDAMCCEYLND